MQRTYLRPPQLMSLSELLAAQASWACLDGGDPWEAAQQLALLDSVARGLPIGALVLWRTHHALSPHAPDGEASGHRLYVLDGGRRLDALTSAFVPSPHSRPVYARLDGGEAAFIHAPMSAQALMELSGEGARWWWPDEAIREAWGLGEVFPLGALLETRARAQVLRGERLSAQAREQRGLRLDRLAGALARYGVTVLTLETDNVDDAADTLARLNGDGRLGERLRGLIR